MQRKIVPGVISGRQQMATFEATATVAEAVAVMSAKKIGAVLVVSGGKLAGIFTERDLMTRVVAPDLSAAATPLSAVMSADPDTLSPEDTADNALELMKSRNYRHLPVLDGDKICGMVSIRDLFSSVMEEIEEDLRAKEKFIFGGDYGAA